jgi:hypothetical protein
MHQLNLASTSHDWEYKFLCRRMTVPAMSMKEGKLLTVVDGISISDEKWFYDGTEIIDSLQTKHGVVIHICQYPENFSNFKTDLLL